jgi:hypothetical protein
MVTETMENSNTKIEYDDEGNPMPPEENFKPEFVAKIEAQQYKKDGGCSL